MLALQTLSLAEAVQVASTTYQVPQKRILGVLQAVSRKPSGVGPMGIPSVWFPVLAKAGFPAWKVELMSQWNVAAGAWILAQEKAHSATARTVQAFPVKLSARWQGRGVQGLAKTINIASQATGVPAPFLAAVMLQESGGDPDARSDKGAMGLMQLIPATAARYGVTNPWNPLQNVLGGAAYLAHLLRRYRDNPVLALAAYNAGSGAVQRYGGIPPYPQTEAYVPAVLQRYNQMTLPAQP